MIVRYKQGERPVKKKYAEIEFKYKAKTKADAVEDYVIERLDKIGCYMPIDKTTNWPKKAG